MSSRAPRLALSLVACVALAGVADAQGARPQTIPALREWVPSAGTFQIGSASRIVVRHPSLASVAEVFGDDLRALLGHPVPIVAGPDAVAGAGDLSLDLGETDARLGAEGYRLVVGAAVAITATQPAGAFYGTRSVLQLLHQASSIPAGTALDWPRYPERGLMIDAGRAYFAPEWIERHIRELAYLKLNHFHLHFSDDGGFRLESESHPEIVAPEHLTKQQLADILALAARYHVTVVPELDMPGHLAGALAAHPEYRLVNLLGQRHASRLDITNPEALGFVRDLMQEFLPLFPGPYWHIGVDEYMPEAEYQTYPQLQSFARSQYGPAANHKDAVMGFVNWADDIVRAHGKTTRLWNDELTDANVVAVHPDVVVEWWTNTNPLSDATPPGPQELLERGHRVANSGWFPTYYNSGFTGDYLFPKPDMRKAYESWEVNEFAGPFFSPAVEGQTVEDPPAVLPADEPRNLGSKVNVWMGDPVTGESTDDVAVGIEPFLRVIAQKTWGSERLTASYAGFAPVMQAVGHAPGFTAAVAPSGTEVGFWAQLNASTYTPEVYTALEESGGALYLLFQYLTDYGPPGSDPPLATLAREVALEANARGIPVNAWIIAPYDQGTFANETNAELMQQAVQAFPVWAAENGVRFREIVLDLEFPVGSQAVFDAFLGGDPTALTGLMQQNVDPQHQCEAVQTYRETISWAHRNGVRITGSPAPFYPDDVDDGYIALQDALDGVAFPPLGYDALYLQAYRTYSNAGPGYVAQFYRDMQALFGPAGQVSLGDTQQGPPYHTLATLVADVRMLAGMGATRIPIFELGGTVQRFGANGVRAIVEAAGNPMTGAELEAASTEQPFDRQHRAFFEQLDTAAVAATRASHPEGPNAYPDGCGDPHAEPLPEPRAGLVWLAALGLLAGLRRLRAPSR